MKWSEVGTSPMTSPGSAAAADLQEPNGDDRMLAAAAHLSTVLGMWVVIPAAIFLVRRKQSSFVAFHALQATVLSVLLMGLSFALLIAFVVFGLVLEHAAGARGQMFGVWMVFLVVVLLVVVVPWLWSVIAALKAWGGKRYSIPIAGAIARRLLAKVERRSAADRGAGGGGGSPSNWSNP